MKKQNPDPEEDLGAWLFPEEELKQLSGALKPRQQANEGIRSNGYRVAVIDNGSGLCPGCRNARWAQLGGREAGICTLLNLNVGPVGDAQPRGAKLCSGFVARG